MKDLIYKHETIDEVQMKFMDQDIKFWTEETAMINIEILFFERMLTSSLFKQVQNINSNVETLLEDLNTVKILNESFQDQLVEFCNKLEMIRECDDVQCETFYLNNHTKFRAAVESHFASYRIYKVNVMLFFDGYLGE